MRPFNSNQRAFSLKLNDCNLLNRKIEISAREDSFIIIIIILFLVDEDLLFQKGGGRGCGFIGGKGSEREECPTPYQSIYGVTCIALFCGLGPNYIEIEGPASQIAMLI